MFGYIVIFLFMILFVIPINVLGCIFALACILGVVIMTAIYPPIILLIIPVILFARLK